MQLIRVSLLAVIIIAYYCKSFKIVRFFAPKLRMSARHAYVPTMGVENSMFLLGSQRVLLPSEYEFVFERFPGLRRLALSRDWPCRVLSDAEEAYFVSSLSPHSENENTTNAVDLNVNELVSVSK